MAKGKKDEWIHWALGGAAVLAALWYLTSQKAGAPMGQPQPQGIAVGEPNPSAPKEGGCGCEMEPGTETTQTQSRVASSSDATSAVPSTG